MKWTALVGLMVMSCASHRGKTVSSRPGSDASLGGSTIGSETGSGGSPAPDGHVTSSDSGGAMADAAPGSGGSGGSDADASGGTCMPNTRWCYQATPMECDSLGVPHANPNCGAATPLCQDGMCVACPGTGGPAMVAVGTFCIDSTEVTQSQYRSWLAGIPPTAGQLPECAWNTDFAPPSRCEVSSLVCPWSTGLCNDSPQVCVDWCDAWSFCKAVGKRLCGSLSGGPGSYSDPSLGQWRKACGGVYPYGDKFQLRACHDRGSTPAGTTQVGTSPECKVLYGGQAVYDLSGNAAEWEDACDAATGGTDKCLARGGSFQSEAAELTCDTIPNPPLRRDVVSSSVGFRCCSP
jgi:hypothetical protein